MCHPYIERATDSLIVRMIRKTKFLDIKIIFCQVRLQLSVIT